MCFPWRGFARALAFTAALSMVGGWAVRASAQQNFDPGQLDAKDAAAAEGKSKSKSKKSAQQKAQQQPSGTQARSGKPGGDRQFGELEGWSPGKTPGATTSSGKKEEDPSGSSSSTPVSLSPSGKPSVGLPF